MDHRQCPCQDAGREKTFFFPVPDGPKQQPDGTEQDRIAKECCTLWQEHICDDIDPADIPVDQIGGGSVIAGKNITEFITAFSAPVNEIYEAKTAVIEK